jgi:mannose/fructose-specific phosphotransferase system component IIA
MSSENVRGIVLAHGDMAQGMIDAVRAIAGVGSDALTSLSNRGLGPDALADEINRLAGAGPTIVFTDLQSGSCGFAARRCVQSDTSIAVISGVNLPILLVFIIKRDLPIAQLVPLLLTKGRAAVVCSPTFENHEHRAVSRG